MTKPHRKAYIERRTKLEPGPPPKRKAWPKRKRSTPRKSGRVIDPEWLDIVRTLRCRVAVTMPRHARECRGRIEADHAGRRGLGQKCSDHEAIPVCTYHHRARTDFSGLFATWKHEQMRAWLDSQIDEVSALVQARKGRL